MDEVLRLQKEKYVLKQACNKKDVECQRIMEAQFKLLVQLENTKLKFDKQKQQAEEMYSRYVKLQAEHDELVENIKGPKITTMQVTKTGTINNEVCEIRGVVTRGGKKSKNNAPGPCMICCRMLDCKTTQKMLLVGVNCPWVGKRGHIAELPELVKEIVDSEEWLQQLNALRLAKYRGRR